MRDDAAPAAMHMLGVSAATFEVTTREALAEVSLAMASQTRRRLDIVSRHLDAALYDNEAFVAAVKQITLNHHSARVRLFILDPRPLLGQGHRLIELATRLTSFIEIRTPAPQHKSFNEALLIADNLGYVRRQFSDRFEAEVDFASRRGATALTERFEQLWQRGQLDANFRRLHL
ncbi:MAG: hypothetical protein IT492_11090 [Gammaproteobacteria bacterium]|nr:hypothetical protein [Gammaproteobacteria bacterium]